MNVYVKSFGVTTFTLISVIVEVLTYRTRLTALSIIIIEFLTGRAWLRSRNSSKFISPIDDVLDFTILDSPVRIC